MTRSLVTPLGAIECSLSSLAAIVPQCGSTFPQVTALSAQNVELRGALAEADAARTLLAAQVVSCKPDSAV